MHTAKKFLFVQRSGIPKTGKGLFTKKDIQKGTCIVEYKGKITTWKHVLESPVFSPYIFYVNRNYVIDAKHDLKALGRYVNDANGLRKIKGLVNNSKYIEVDGRIYIQAIKNIPAGNEIFVSYKKEYWEVIKYNSRLKANKKSKKTKRT